MRRHSGPMAARAKHAARAIVRTPLRAIAVLAMALMLLSGAPAAAGEAERELPGGRFFTQTGDGATTGFAVVDDADADFWTFFQASGGVAQLGYPISRRWQDGPFIYQAFQKAILQQRPSGGIAFVNIYDRLSALGHDAWLSSAKLVPRPWEFAEDQGQPFAVVQGNHLALLDLNPDIKAAWYANTDWLNAFGLPVAYDDRGDVRVLRAQRAVFQQWMIATTFAPLGGVVIANGGDHFKAAGQIPTAATVPELPPNGHETIPTASEGQTDFFGRPCQSTSNPNPEFTAPVTDLGQISVITPPGIPAGGVIKAHSYFRPTDAGIRANGGLGVPVYAPVDSTLVSVAYYVENGVHEYLMFFEVSCEVIYKLDHVRSVVEKIRAVAPDAPQPDSRTTRVNPRVSVTAGELIAYSWSHSWDFGVYAIGHRNQFVNQARYDTGYEDQELHATCPYDFYPDPLRAAHYALFGTPDQVRVGGETCRSASRDVAGTLAGAWFAADRPGENAGFAIATALSGRVIVTGPGINLFIDPGMPTYADPAQITTAHCYLSGGSWVFLQRLVDGRLTVASGGGSCPGGLPAGYQTFVR